MARAKKEVATVETGTDIRPSFMGDTERGSEGVSIQDITIPRIQLIQDLSPQLKKNKAEYIEGAEVGMLFNTVTGKLYDKVVAVPVFYQLEWVVWKHRDLGGGFLGAFDSQAEAVAFAGQHELAQQTVKGEPAIEIQDTGQQYCLIIDENDACDEAVISLAKSAQKANRLWNTMIKLSGGDRFERFYRLTSVEAESQSGEYRTWKIEQAGFVNEAIFRRAEEFYENVKKGVRKINRDDVTAAPETDDM